MDFNFSRSRDGWCFLKFLNVSGSSEFYGAIVGASVLSAVLAPMAVAGNGLILAAIWRSPSLRTPSYVLLAGLAVTDFCTGILTQPLAVVNMIAAIRGKIKMHCITVFATECPGLYFSSLTVVTITMIAVERWLHMRRRSLLTVRRVVIIYSVSAFLLILLVACRVYTYYYPNLALNVIVAIYYLAGLFCIALTAFAYFEVFQIIRHHQNQVRANENAIDMEKYKKSIFTILYIVAIAIVSYTPYICCILAIHLVSDYGMSVRVTAHVCAVVALSSSSFNPLLYICRIKEIRDSVQNIISTLVCKRKQEEP